MDSVFFHKTFTCERTVHFADHKIKTIFSSLDTIDVSSDTASYHDNKFTREEEWNENEATVSEQQKQHHASLTEYYTQF